MKCALFKGTARFLKFRPQDGLSVLARGTLEVYEARGEYQLIVELLEPQGAGALQLAFDQLNPGMDRRLGRWSAILSDPADPQSGGERTGHHGCAFRLPLQWHQRHRGALLGVPHRRNQPEAARNRATFGTLSGVQYNTRLAHRRPGAPGHRGRRGRFLARAQRALDHVTPR